MPGVMAEAALLNTIPAGTSDSGMSPRPKAARHPIGASGSCACANTIHRTGCLDAEAQHAILGEGKQPGIVQNRWKKGAQLKSVHKIPNKANA